jgi:hypothetical protein
MNSKAPELIPQVSEFRQLTETKRSPVAAIEDHQKRAINQQRRECAVRPRRVGEGKILNQRTNLRFLDLIQTHPVNESEGSLRPSPRHRDPALIH